PVPIAVADSELSNGIGIPVRIIIPRINLDAVIKSVGLTVNGAMDAPKIPAETGWFSLGVRPGEVGSAVIAGHSGWKNNIPSAFDELNKLRVGDSISVVDDNGAVTTFIVRKIQIYDPNADASDVFSSSDGKAHLNLITCEGVWNKISKSFSKRLVVFTDKEE
ncbi:MAG: class F sortase, partial [Patescibacteria group bacterium]